MSIGENIRRIRKDKKLTQKELGEKLEGISQQQIGQWENGNKILSGTGTPRVPVIIGRGATLVSSGKFPAPKRRIAPTDNYIAVSCCTPFWRSAAL